MSILSTSLYGSSTSKGVGGLLSGLDTDELVKQMTAGTRNKINKQYQSKQKLLYRQEAYREVSSKLLALSNKYFSYSSSKTNILSPGFFEANTFKSSSNYVNVTGNPNNIKNFEITEISSVATAASFASTKKVASESFSTNATIPNEISRLAGATFSISVPNDKVYSFTIDQDFNGKSIADVNTMLTELNKKLDEVNAERVAKGEDKVSFGIKDGKFEITGGGVLSAASNDFLDALNMKVAGKDEKGVEGDTISESNLVRSRADILGSDKEYITFEYNGVLKQIKMDPKITNTDELASHLENELNSAFGTGKIKVDKEEGKDKITFKAIGDNNVLGVSSISKDLSKLTGLKSGDYNRVNKNSAIEDVRLENGSKLTADTFTIKNDKDEDVEFAGYKLDINGKELTIAKGTSLNDIIKKINNETDVNIYYSSTTNTFSVKAKETGANKGVSIKDVNGQLAASLFGQGLDEALSSSNEIVKSEDGVMNLYDDVGTKIGKVEYNKEKGQYEKFYDTKPDEAIVVANASYQINKGTDTVLTYELNGVETKITRSTANFSVDEINIELNEKAAGLKSTDNPITFDVINNSDEVVERVKKFIDEYNEIINLIGTKTKEKPSRSYLPLTPEQQDDMKEDEIKNWNEEAKKGSIYGDRNMNSLLSSLKRAMASFTDTSTLSLTSIGISSASMDTSGKLTFDEKKFKEKLLENPDEIAKLFTGTSTNGEGGVSGIAVQMKEILVKNVGEYGNTGVLIEEAGLPGGMTADQNFISKKMKEYDDKMATLKKALEVERTRYWNQFAALENSLSKLNAQSSWLTDMMGN